MALYEHIPDQPDRDTEDHTRTLYAETTLADGRLHIMTADPNEWVRSDTYRANFR